MSDELRELAERMRQHDDFAFRSALTTEVKEWIQKARSVGAHGTEMVDAVMVRFGFCGRERAHALLECMRGRGWIVGELKPTTTQKWGYGFEGGGLSLNLCAYQWTRGDVTPAFEEEEER